MFTKGQHCGLSYKARAVGVWRRFFVVSFLCLPYPASKPFKMHVTLKDALMTWDSAELWAIEYFQSNTREYYCDSFNDLPRMDDGRTCEQTFTVDIKEKIYNHHLHFVLRLTANENGRRMTGEMPLAFIYVISNSKLKIK